MNVKCPIHSVILSDFTLWHTWWKNWVNCSVFTDSSAGLGTVLSGHLSHRELRILLRESQNFLSLPAYTVTASSQGTLFLSVHSADEHRTIYSFPNTTSYSTFYTFFSDNIMTDVASKQQTTALFLSTTVTHTRRHTELTKNWQTWCETCAVPENIQFSFLCSFFTQLNCTI
jgi:hypothetical protein